MDNYNNDEIWRSVPGYERVEVSNKGRVKRLPYKHNKGRIYTEFFKDRDGYCKVNVKKEGGGFVQRYVHRLVAEAFIDNVGNKPLVNHKNSIRTDNRAENLEWCTTKENTYHAYAYGKRSNPKNVPRNTVLNDYQISQIGKLREIYSLAQIAKLFSIKYTTLKNIIRKEKQRKELDNQQPSTYSSIYK